MRTNFLFVSILIFLLTACTPTASTYTPVENHQATTTQSQPGTTATTSQQPKEKPIIDEYPDELNTAKGATYMSEREQQMIAEVNLVRSNPQAYVKYLEPYRRRQQSRIKHPPTRAKEMAAIDELIEYLKESEPQGILQPHADLQKTATKHVRYLKVTGEISHEGEGNSQPWDRIMSDNPKFTDGNENLVGGPLSVRDAVIILLVDRDVPSRGHRHVLMQSDWEYLGCASVKRVGEMTNFWVQNYAKTSF